MVLPTWALQVGLRVLVSRSEDMSQGSRVSGPESG